MLIEHPVCLCISGGREMLDIPIINFSGGRHGCL
jgi:hypothetical protein